MEKKSKLWSWSWSQKAAGAIMLQNSPRARLMVESSGATTTTPDHNHTGPQPHSCVLTSHSRHYWCCGTDMRTIWDVADNEDNEETEVAKVVDGQPPTCNSDTWDSKSKTGKTAINRGQNWGQTTGTTSHKHRTSPNPAPALFGDCHY